MTTRLTRIALALAASMLVPAGVSAQLVGSDAPPPASVRRPYRGLFANPGSPEAPQSLVASASIFGAYDDNVTAALQGTDSSNNRLQKSGDYYGASAGLQYNLSKSVGRVAFGVGSGASASYYRVDDDRSLSPHANLNGSMRVALGRRSAISVNQQVVYSEYYRFLLFPGFVVGDDDGFAIGDPDMELFARKAFRYGTGINFSQSFGSRSSFSAGYSHSFVDYRDSDLADWRNQGAYVGFDRRVTAHATLNLGYGYRTASGTDDETGSEPRETHNVNVGMSYSRALSFSRRTSVSFSTGSGFLVRDDLRIPGNDPTAHFRLIGNFILNHEIGRSWTAQAAYYRGFVFREGFDDPFLTDGLSASVGGFINRRLDLFATARWSLGSSDRPGNDNHNAFSLGVQSRYALNQFLAIFARYIYYQYDFGEAIPLDPEIARSLDRQGVRVGLTASFPIF